MLTKFEWDPAKALANLRKHGVSFETAMRVFADPPASSNQDRIECGEPRRITIGVVEGYVLLVVAHAVHNEDDGTEIICIISARRADPKERKDYEQNG